MLKKIKKNQGLTLIEIIVTLAIMGIVGVMTFSLYMNSNRMTNIGQKQANSQFNTRRAAAYITKEIRAADTVTILNSLPSPLEANKKYIYVEGNSIKYYVGGLITKVIEGDSTFLPTLEFKNSSGGKILNFNIHCQDGTQAYDVNSEVTILNMKSADNILGSAQGSVISFGPFTNPEVVQVDNILFDLAKSNIHLVKEADGTYTLPPPPISDYITLQEHGENGTDIEWSSSSTTIDVSTGAVDRPLISATDVDVDLTATFRKDPELSQKVIRVKVKKMAAMDIGNMPPPSAQKDNLYTPYTFKPIGGDGVYDFTAVDLGNGLTLDENGILTGTPNTVGTVAFTVTLKDSLGNTISKGTSITVN